MTEPMQISFWDAEEGCWKWRRTASGLRSDMRFARRRQRIVCDKIRYLRSWHPGYAARTQPEIERLIRELHENRKWHTLAVKSLREMTDAGSDTDAGIY